MKKFVAVLPLICVVSSSCFSPRVLAQPASATKPEEGKVLLRLRLKKGQRFINKVSFSSILESNDDFFQGLDSKAHKQSIEFETQILGVSPAGTITQCFTFLRMNNFNDFERTIIGAPLTAKITPTGELVSIQGSAAAANRASKSMAESFGDEKRFRKNLQVSYDNRVQKLCASGKIYSSQAVGVGESWTVPNLNFYLPAKITFRLKERRGGVAFIEGRGLAKTIQPGLKIEAILHVSFQVNEVTGVVQHSNLKTDVKQELTIRPSTKPIKATSRINISTTTMPLPPVA